MLLEGESTDGSDSAGSRRYVSLSPRVDFAYRLLSSAERRDTSPDIVEPYSSGGTGGHLLCSVAVCDREADGFCDVISPNGERSF